jgi:hypothetical protein
VTLAEQIQAKMTRREDLRVELKAVEEELMAAGAILALSVKSAGFLRNRGRLVKGDSCRAQILAVVSDGADWQVRDIIARVPVQPESVRAQLSRMTIEGDLVRVSHGILRRSGSPLTAAAVAQPMEVVTD